MNAFSRIFGMLFLLAFISAGCNQEAEETFDEKQETHAVQKEPEINKAIAVLHPTEGNDVKGVITFTRLGDQVKVEGKIEGLQPGKHGFHVHEFGDCSASDAASAGGHYNPTNNQHSAPTSEDRHTGDLGNIEADDNGVANISYTGDMISFSGINNILGRAVVVHEGEDDLTSQPSGNAGSRVACGVVGAAKE